MEEKLSDEEVEKVYEVIYERVSSRLPPSVQHLKFVKIKILDRRPCSLGLEMKMDRFIERCNFLVCKKTGEIMFVNIPKESQLSSRSIVESMLEVLKEGHNVCFMGETVFRAGETLESLLLERDLNDLEEE